MEIGIRLQIATSVRARVVRRFGVPPAGIARLALVIRLGKTCLILTCAATTDHKPRRWKRAQDHQTGAGRKLDCFCHHSGLLWRRTDGPVHIFEEAAKRS